MAGMTPCWRVASLGALATIAAVWASGAVAGGNQEGRPAAAPGVPESHGRPAQAKAGARSSPAGPIDVFRASCLECHDSDGRGAAGRDLLPEIPDFTDVRWQASRSDDALSRSILRGKGKSMPRMKDKLGTVDVTR